MISIKKREIVLKNENTEIMNFSSKLKFEDIKKIVQDSISHLDIRETWMITWIDKIFEGNDNNMYFTAIIHRIKAKDKLKFELKNLDLNQPSIVTLPLRLIRIFPVGTIFKDGEVQFKSHLEYLSTFVLDIDTSKSHDHFRLGDWKHGHELINALAFNKIKFKQGYSFASNSMIRVFPNAKSETLDFDYIVIRALEIDRFYWFPSTRLMIALMKGESNSYEDSLYIKNSALQKNIDGVIHHEIILNDKMHLRDHPYIARLAFDKNALFSANLIYKSILNAKNGFEQKSDIHLDGTFPFKNETTLNVKAFTINIPTCKILVVTEILTCYGPWPFENLEYDRATANGISDPELEPNGIGDTPNDDSKNDGQNKENDDEQEEEDKLENQFYNPRNPFLPNKPSFNPRITNNKNILNFEIEDKAIRFPNLTENRKRMERTRPVAPKKYPTSNPTPVDNISTDEKKGNEGSSTNLDVVSKENGIKIRRERIETQEFITTLCNLYLKDGAQIDFVVNGNEKFHKEFSTTSIRDGIEILIYMVRIRMPNFDFILIELDPIYGSSLKLITKTDGFEKTIDDKDVEIIFLALHENCKTLATLNSKKYKVSLVYHVEKCTTLMYKNRIDQKVKQEKKEKKK